MMRIVRTLICFSLTSWGPQASHLCLHPSIYPQVIHQVNIIYSLHFELSLLQNLLIYFKTIYSLAGLRSSKLMSSPQQQQVSVL